MPTKLSPFSMLLGAASLGVVLITLSAFQVPAGTSPTTSRWADLPLTINGPVQVEGIPASSQMMRVVEGTRFIVPEGNVLVVTGLGVATPATTTNAYATFDGAQVMGTLLGEGCGSDGPPIAEIPPGLVAAAGQVVDVLATPAGAGVLLGYLADAAI